jgi:hypothetical protein
MLSSDGKIDFTDELMGLVEDFVETYQASLGQFRNDLERSLVIAYALGVLSCNVDCLWNALGSAPAFGPVQPKRLFEECRQLDQEAMRQRLAVLGLAMQERGWLPEREG